MKRKWRVRNDLVAGQKYGVSTFVSNMANFRGKEVTPTPVVFNIEEDNGEWNWTPEMFEDGPVPDCPFRRGDEVEVWNYSKTYAEKRIFVAYVPGTKCPYQCVGVGYEQDFFNGKEFGTTPWKHCRPPDLKEGDPVIVWDEPEHERRRVFAGWSCDGRIKCFVDGLTKWTSEGRTASWDHWRLPTEEELNQ